MSENCTAVMPAGFRPRSWQSLNLAKCVKHYRDRGRNFLLVACPGAGKTMASLMVAAEFLRRGWCDRLCIITPSLALNEQWVRKSREVGIDAFNPASMSQLGQGLLPLSVPAIVLNYQRLNQPNLLAQWVSAQRTFLILDEVHHCAESRMWGDAVAAAGDAAVYRMALSGTPFREDSYRIPFVHYDDETQHCVADNVYGYEDAIKDGVCRPIEFPWFDGQHEWTLDGRRHSASFEDDLPDELSGHRLAAATDAGTEMMRMMAVAANDQLTTIRSLGGYHASAGGLCVARSEKHATDLAAMLREISGEDPVVVHQNVPNAHEQIRAFAASDQRWIVSIKIVSEGVDIPRLRVGIYASNIRKSLFFRQVAGRFVRVINDARSERAFVYIPGDPTIKDIAEEIEREKCHALGLEYRRGLTPMGSARGKRSPPKFSVLSSSGEMRAVIASGENIPRAELDEACDIRRKNPSMFIHMTDVQLVMALRHLRAGGNAA